MMQARESSRCSGALQLRVLGLVSRSPLFLRYQSAFGEATGIALHLASADGRLLDDDGMRHRNAFCMQLHAHHTACVECCRMRRKMAAFGGCNVSHFTCFAGFCESCVPIRIGTMTMGLLVAGEVTTHPPSQAKFDGIMTRLYEDGHSFDKARLRRAYFSVHPITRGQYEAFINLLEIFAAHLSLVANRIALHESDSADPAIRRAREYIHSHLEEPLALKEVARRANLSACYFSTKFRDSTGLAFTEYVATARVEKARRLLAIPGMRVSEIAFAVGFQSLTRFNRVFKDMTGCSPTRFRESEAGAAPEPTPPMSNHSPVHSKNPVSTHAADAVC